MQPVNEYWHLSGATLLRDQGPEWRLRVRPLSRHELDAIEARWRREGGR